MKPPTSSITIFTLRGASPFGSPEVGSACELIQANTPAPHNRIATGPSEFKMVGRREYQNVIRNFVKSK
jgi:hypothetical protein